MEKEKINCIHKTEAVLGECPKWDPIKQKIYWTDIDGYRLWSVDEDGSGALSVKVKNKVGSFAICNNSEFICGTDDGVFMHQPFISSGKWEKIWDYPEPQLQPEGRFNDGCCDAAGRFIVGTVDRTKKGQGGVYSYREGAKVGRKVLDGFTTFNGLAFNKDNTEAWFSDTDQRIIWRASYDLDTGEFGERKEVIKFPSDQKARPDGASFDTEGNYWVAMYEGGCVHCISPEGEIKATYEIPAIYTTMAAFVGPKLDKLVVTTCHRDNEEERKEHPLAGGLFLIEGLGVTGTNSYRFGK